MVNTGWQWYPYFAHFTIDKLNKLSVRYRPQESITENSYD